MVDNDESALLARRQRSLNTDRLYEVARDNTVKVVVFTPDGKYAIVGGIDCKITIINASNGAILCEEKFGHFIFTMSISNDGECLVVGGSQETNLREDEFLDISGGESRRQEVTPQEGRIRTYRFIIDNNQPSLSPVQTLTLESEVSIISIHPSSSSNYVAAGCENGTLRIYDINESFKLTQKRDLQRDDKVRVTCFSPKGNQLVAGGFDNKFTVYDVEQEWEVHHEEEMDGIVNVVSFSADGTYLSVAGEMESIFTYNTATNPNMYVKTNETKVSGTILDLEYCPSGRFLIAAGENKKIVIYDSYTLHQYKEIYFGDRIWSTCFSPDGAHLAIAGRSRKVEVLDTSCFDSNFKEIPISVKGNEVITDIAYFPDTDRLAMAQDHSKVSFLNVLNGDTTSAATHDVDGGFDNHLFAIAIDKSGKKLAVGGYDKMVRIYDSTTMKKIKELPKERGGFVNTIAYSPDSKYIAVGSSDKKLTIYHASTMEEEHVFERDKAVTAVAYSPGGRFIAIGGEDLKLTIHDCTNSTNMVQLHQMTFTTEIVSLSFSVGDKLLAVAECGGKLSFFDTECAFKQFLNPLHFDKDIKSVSFVGTMNEQDQLDHHTIAVLTKAARIFELRIHAKFVMPPEILLKNTDDRKIIRLLIENRVSAYTRTNSGRTTLSLAVEESRVPIVQCLLHNEPSAALVPDIERQSATQHLSSGIRMSQPLTNKCLSFLLDHHHMKDIQKIAGVKFQVTTSHDILNKLTDALLKCAKMDNTDGAISILEAGEVQSFKGFVVIANTYRHDITEEWWGTFFPAWIRRIKQKMLSQNSQNNPDSTAPTSEANKNESDKRNIAPPLSVRLIPRSSSSPCDHETWDDLKEDNYCRVKCKILQVMLPDLSSLETLKALTQMSSNKAMGTHAIDTSIEAVWFKSFRIPVLRHAILYIVTCLVPFIVFYEVTRKVEPSDFGGVAFASMFLTLCGLIFFSYLELKSMATLGTSYYWSDYWNLTQWITKALVLISIGLAFSESISHSITAPIASIAIMMSFVRFFFYLTVFEEFAWIVIALYKITVGVRFFIFVLGLVLITFSMGFYFLDKGDKYEENGKLTAFGTFWSSLRSTFLASIVGYVEIAELDDYSSDSTFMIILFFSMLAIILVISLNAFIAFVGDTFDKVLASKVAILRKQRAKMMIEYYSFLSAQERKDIEENNKWVTVIVPESALQMKHNDELSTFRKANKEDISNLKEEMKREKDETKKQMILIKEELKKETRQEINGIKEEIKEIKEGMKVMEMMMKEMLILLKNQSQNT